MSETITLKGIAWDHPRGYEPLRAASAAFTKKHPEVRIEWDIRSLKEFGDTPIEDLIDAYDLITIDHPYMGQAHSNKLLVPLEERLSETALNEYRNQSVGPSFESYYYNGHLYALPIDAAALVSASRRDLISTLHLELPGTREKLFDFYKEVPTRYSIAWPLCATDLWCTFLTLCAQDGGKDFIKNRKIDEKMGSTVWDELKEHLKHLHPESLNWNPIQVLDYMAAGDEVIYSPFLFGYTNYSREGYAKNVVHFNNSPTNPANDVSTILGGVGLAVSAKCKQVDLAVAYVDYMAWAETQESLYTENGGQPGNLIAWESTSNNLLCHDFFDGTRTTMEKAYVRPRHKGWNEFQEQGAELLHKGLVKNSSSSKVMKNLNQLYQSIV
ncbi:ABC transporter substrate-binding protein [Ulvibacterium marinum]|uniref:ABC transporter substrate-binding protein n=1 Tax=Ulvibacterium marinum TaxID=2419782 RepID=UPI00249500F4|nr:extracellular solute-binding protein [Ulvibacterium marinum]